MKKSFCYSPTKLDIRISKLDVSLADIVEENEDGLRVPSDSCSGVYCSTLRGLYDEHHPDEHVDWESMEDSEVIKKLGDFRKELSSSQAKKIRSNSSNMSSAFYRLRQSIPASVRTDRINMIANEFSRIVTEYQIANPQYTRNAITNGIRLEDGSIALGETAIFDEIFKELCKNMQTCELLGKTYEADEVCKILDNWESLVTLVRIKLRDTEGLILGGKASYSAAANSENFSDNYISDMFNLEEATREGWQEIAESVSAYASLSKGVRRTLSMLPQLKENGEQDTDDLKKPKFMNPMQAYQSLLKITRGSVSSAHMLSLMNKAMNEGQQWLKPVIDALTPSVLAADGKTVIKITPELDKASMATQYQKAKDDLAKGLAEQGYSQEEIEKELAEIDSENSEKWRNLTAFNDALGKTFIFLSVLKEVFKEGIYMFKTRVLNRVNSLNTRSVAVTNIKFGKVLNKDVSIYDEKGNIDWKGVSALESVIESDFISKDGSIFGPVITSGTAKEKRSALIKVANALGLKLTQDAASSILSDRNSKQAFIDAVKQLLEYGLRNKTLSSMRGNKLSASKALDFKAENNPSDEGVIAEVITKLADIIAPYADNTQYESRVPYVDKKGKKTTLSSEINPSYLSSKMDMIAALVKTGDRNKLRKYLEREFFSSPFYAERNADGSWNIHSLWLRELYNSEVVGSGEDARFDPSSFAAQFTYKRFLGDDKSNGAQRYEDYTEKKHALSMLMEFMGERETSSKGVDGKFAYYSVFIQGDSGVSKYIKGRVYTEQEVMDNMYEMYQQELIRMRLTRDSNAYLSRENYPEIDNLKGKDSSFTMMPFLNKVLTPKWEDGKLVVYKANTNTVADPQYIRKAISDNMATSFDEFYSKIAELGLLQKTEDGRYTYLQNFANPKKGRIGNLTGEDQLREQLRLFFMNHRLNMIAQIQMFTVDPGFYKGVKDFQKRYKEIHAPGTRLDPTAYDVWNNRPVSDGIERCVYFDDISIDSEINNEDFMEVLAKVYGKDSDIYNSYKNNTLTDGQGFRTIDSYRKVMIMAGGDHWNAKTEEAYREIKAIQAKGTLTSDDIARLQELAVKFQPIKPYLYTMENLPCSTDGVLKVPVQHKYAEIVLIPELLPEGSKLRQLAIAMQDNNIDMVGSTKIVKVGGFGSTAFDFKVNEQGLYIDKDGNVLPGKTRDEQRDIKKHPDFRSRAVPCELTDISSALKKGYVHQLSYSDYRLQTNVPDHINHAALFGTQIRKLIMIGLQLDVQDEIRDRKRFEHYEDYVTDSNGNPAEINLGLGKPAKLNGRRLLWFYNQLIVSNIVEGLDNFLTAISDDESISRQLIQNVISNSREMQDNILAYSLTNDERFLVPLFEAGISHNTSATLLSILKKMINKQQIAGGSAVQASAWGITSVNEAKPDDGGLKYVTNDDNTNILYAECEIPFNFKVSTGKGGEEIQLDFNKYCFPNGEFKLSGKKINIGGKLVDETLIESDYPGILDIVAYRIPTEAHYSMMNLRVKRCSLPEAGGVIKVPSQGTTQAGFDFDIDKLYLMRKEFIGFTESESRKIWNEVFKSNPWIKEQLLSISKSKYPDGLPSDVTLDMLLNEPIFEGTYDRKQLFKDAAKKLMNEKKLALREDYEYDPSKPCLSTTDNNGNTIEGNGRIARNNMLLHLVRQRLMDKETLSTRYTPGGFEQAKVAAKAMRVLTFSDTAASLAKKGALNMDSLLELVETEEDPEPEYDYSDPITMLVYNQQNQVASKLIGIFANQNVNHAFASLMQSYVLNKPIAFGSYVDYGLSDLIHNPMAGQTTAEFLAASVDAVKDPVLNFLNLNVITADSGAVLARLGYSSLEIGLLFNQPAIKFICEQSFNYNLSLDEAIEAARAKYPSSKTIDVSNRENVLGTARLAQNITLDRVKDPSIEGEEFKAYQSEIISLFEQITRASKEVSEFINSTRWTASNAVKSRMGDMYAQQLKVQRYIDEQKLKNETETSMVVAPGFRTVLADGNSYDLQSKGIAIGDGKVTSDIFRYVMSFANNPFAYEQAMFDAYRRALEELCDKYYPYNTPLYDVSRNLLDKVSLYGLNGDIVESMHQDLMTYVLSKVPGSRFSGNSLIRRGDSFGDQSGKVASDYYFKEVFAQKLFDLYKSGDPIFNTPLMRAIRFDSEEITNWDGSKTTKLKVNIPSVRMTPQEVDAIKESWEDMLINGSPAAKEIAEDLFFYNFFNNGFSYGPTAFTELAPAILRANIVVGRNADGSPLLYRDVLNLLQEGKLFSMTTDLTSKDFVRQFIANNYDNKRLVYTIKIDPQKSTGIFVSGLTLDDKGKPVESFTVSATSTKNIKDNPFVRVVEDPVTGKQKSIFKAAVMVNNTLYMCDNGELVFNETEGNNPIQYTAIEVSTDKEYNRNTEQAETLDEDMFESDTSIGTSVIGEWVEPSLTPRGVTAEEQALIDSMKPEVRALYESLSEDRKQEILRGLKSKKCYEVFNGKIREAIC